MRLYCAIALFLASFFVERARIFYGFAYAVFALFWRVIVAARLARHHHYHGLFFAEQQFGHGERQTGADVVALDARKQAEQRVFSQYDEERHGFGSIACA